MTSLEPWQKKYAREGNQVFIVSGDKDFMQLINDEIFLYTPGKRNASPVIYDAKGVLEKWALPPEKIIFCFPN